MNKGGEGDSIENPNPPPPFGESNKRDSRSGSESGWRAVMRDNNRERGRSQRVKMLEKKKNKERLEGGAYILR